MNFKYSLTLSGKKDRQDQFTKEIETLGYLGEGGYGPFLTLGGPTDNKDYQYNTWLFQTSPFKRDYDFNIDNEWEYQAALAIASIRNDDNFHIGEWVVMKSMGGHNSSHKWYLQSRKMAYEPWPQKIVLGKIDEIDETFDGGVFKINDTSYRRSYTEKATPEEIIEFFKHKYNKVKDRKIIGYRLIKDSADFKKGDELKEKGIFGSGKGWYGILDGDRVGFAQKYIDKGLGEWFEPIYEERVKQETLILGSNSIKVTINSNKQIGEDNHGFVVNIQAIKTILETLDKLEDLPINDMVTYSTSISKDVRFLRVGCKSENNLFSYNELQQVFDTYNKLNP